MSLTLGSGKRHHTWVMTQSMLIQECHAHKRLKHITFTSAFRHLSVCDEYVPIDLNPCPSRGAASPSGSDRPLDAGSVEPAAVPAVLHFEICELPLAALSQPEQQYNPESHCKASC